MVHCDGYHGGVWRYCPEDGNGTNDCGLSYDKWNWLFRGFYRDDFNLFLNRRQEKKQSSYILELIERLGHFEELTLKSLIKLRPF